jgi:hypothetical protein
MKKRSESHGKERETLPLEGGGKITFDNTSPLQRRRKMKSSFVFNDFIAFSIFIGFACPVHSVAQSPYMGGEVNLTKAPNGAVVREEVLKTGARILYLEPTTEKLAYGVWCIGGYSLANTTVIEAEDGLIVYDTGDTKEEAEHIREAIKKK